MNITIHGQDYRVSDTVENYAKEKLEKLQRYLPHIADIRMELSRQNTKRGGDLTIAQITLRHERGAILRAEEKIEGDDRDAVKAAINAAVDKMYRRIDRFKGKRMNRKGKERFIASIEELETAEDIPAGMMDGFDAVTRRKTIPVEMMDEQEAVQQMELLGHNFFMYLDQDSGKVCVVYRRATGDYGVLVPNGR
jgi:putative sigma-54 modulation protein